MDYSVEFPREKLSDIFRYLAENRGGMKDGDILEIWKNIFEDCKEFMNEVIMYYTSDLAKAGKIEDAFKLAILNKELFSDRPEAWIAFSNAANLYGNDVALAETALLRAREMAKKEGNFFIQANIELISLYALMTPPNTDGIERLMKEIMDYKPPVDAIDSGYSVKMIRSLEKIGVDARLIDSYIETFRKREQGS